MAVQWGPVFRQHHQSLVHYLTTVVKNHADAQDIAQDTYTRILTRPLPPTIDNPKGYLFAAAFNLALNHLHSSKRAMERSLVPSCEESFLSNSFGEPAPEPSDALEQDELIELLNQGLSSLPENCRTAFWMQRFGDLSYADISESLGVSESMIEKYVMRAVAHCRAYATADIERYRLPSHHDDWSLLLDNLRITAAQLVDYHRRGLTVIPAAIPPAKLVALRDAARSCGGDSSINWYNAWERGGISLFRTVFCVWRRSEIFRELVFHSSLPLLAARLLGADGARIFLDQLFIKVPGSYPTSRWYRDSDYLPTHRDGIVGMIVPLDNAGGEAVLQWRPHSHRYQAVKEESGEGSEDSCENVVLRPGDCIVYHGCVLQRLASLRVRDPLHVLTLRFVDPHAQWRSCASSVFNYEGLRAQLPRTVIRAGAPVRSPYFPVVGRQHGTSKTPVAQTG